MARIEVKAGYPVANLVITRESDGHELSLSSMGHGNLIEWAGSEVIRDYGDWNTNAGKFAAILEEFLAVENEVDEVEEPANVYARHEHRSA